MLICTTFTYWNFPYTFHLMYIQPISHDIAIPPVARGMQKYYYH